MARPRVFISSTFYNLQEVRLALASYVRSLSFDPVVTENITYVPGQPLDESCYAEAGSCDLFVLIVGGRYGAEATPADRKSEKAFYDTYKSITRKEFEAALARDVPIYVLVDRSVHTEYLTFRMNRDNETVRYASVDSVNVFHLIEFITGETQTPVKEFERASEIIDWLGSQWGGLFQKLLSDRSDAMRFATLEAQVLELENVATTMKRYLEEIIGAADGGRGDEIIASEEKRLAERSIDIELETRFGNTMWWHGGDMGRLALTLPGEKGVFARADDLRDLASGIINTWLAAGHFGENDLPTVAQTIDLWQREPEIIDVFNEVRTTMGLPEFDVGPP